MLVYKYVQAARIDILENGVIRFTQPAALNDPFETYPCFKLVEESIKRRARNYVNSLESRAEFGATVVASLLIPKKARESSTALQREISTELALLSLTTKRNNLLMWSYADSHRGFVLGFDSEHPFFQGGKSDLVMPLRKVSYSARRRVIPPFEEIPSTKDLAEIVAYTKSEHWSYEEELRMLAHVSVADKVLKGTDGFDIYLYELPGESLREIIMGYLMPKPLKKNISQIAGRKYPHAQLFEARLNDSEFDLDIVPYNS